MKRLFAANPACLLAGAAVLLALGSLWGQIYWSSFHADEAFYLAVPYRFFLGDRPFVDELNIAQTFALLTGPLLKAFCKIQGSNEGIVLFSRGLYALFVVLVALPVYFALAPWLGRVRACLAATAPLVLIHGEIFNLGYKTLGCGLFTLGIFCGFRAVTSERAGVAFLLSGVCLALVYVAHPVFFVAGACYACLLAVVPSEEPFEKPLRLGSKSRQLKLAIFILGCLAAAALSFLAVSWGTLSEMRRYHDSTSFSRHALVPSFVGIVRHILFENTAKKLGFLAGTLWVASRMRKPAFLFLAPGLVFVPLVCGLALGGYLVYLSLLAPCYLAGLRDRSFYLRLLTFVWFPSVLAGFCVAGASDSGLGNAVIGLLPAGVVSVVGLLLLVDQAVSPRPHSGWKGLAPICGLLFVCVGVGLNWRYRVKSSLFGTTLVTQGPYKGVHLPNQLASCLDQLGKDLNALHSESGRILFYGGVSAHGYLHSRMRSLAPSVWKCWNESSFCVDHVSKRRSALDVIVVSRREHLCFGSPSGAWQTAIGGLGSLVTEFEPSVVTSEYIIFTERGRSRSRGHENDLSTHEARL